MVYGEIIYPYKDYDAQGASMPYKSRSVYLEHLPQP